MKTNIKDLAIFGGRPAFKEPLHVGKPNLIDREKLFNRFNKMLDRNWLTNNGPYVRELEKKIAAMAGVKHCIAMNNGTIALEITIRGLELSGEVIVPSFTFIATAHALQWQQITPVFCDIDPDTYCLDPERIEELITPKTTGIIAVNLFGNICRLEELEKIAERRNLKLIFDSAHAFSCTYQGKQIGGFGNAEVLSFHATKFFGSGEGGAVLTNDDLLAEKVRLMKNFGFAGHDKVIYIGTNGKMSEFSAAVGLTNLENIEQTIEHNKKNYELYKQNLKNIPGIKLINYDSNERRNYQYIVLEIQQELFGVNRDILQHILMGENVLARRYFFPGCHRMQPYKSFFPHSGLLLPVTEEVAENVLSLPTGTAISQEDIREIAEIIGFVYRNRRRINAGYMRKQYNTKFEPNIGNVSLVESEIQEQKVLI